LKQKNDELLSKIAFKFILRPCSEGEGADVKMEGGEEEVKAEAGAYTRSLLSST
jgi:hypothetical protein